MPSYPGSIANFTTKVDGVDVIDANDPNSIQAEVVAIQTALGINPATSVQPNPAKYVSTSQTYGNLSSRVANVEHGVVADSHPQYVHKAGGDTIANTTASTVALTIRAASGQSSDILDISDSASNKLVTVNASGVLWTASTGLVIGKGQVGTTVTSITAGATASAGSTGLWSDAGHVHAAPAADPVATVAGFRTLGTGSQQAAAGNHTHSSLALSSYTETATTVYATSGTTTIDLAAATYFVVSMETNTTFTFANVPPSGRVASATLVVIQDSTGGHVFTPPANSRWSGQTQPAQDTLANAISVYSVFTADGGGTWYWFLSGKGMG